MMEKIKSIIVEDQALHSRRLKKMLAATDERIEIVAVCDTIEEALLQIGKHQPELLFLDIQLQDNPRAGFDLLKSIEHPSFDVIFTTAHIDSNIKEIRQCGLGYLVKTYVANELKDALQKVWDKRVGHVGLRQLDTLLSNLVTEQADEQQIWIKLADEFIVLKIKELVYCKGDDQYTYIFVATEGSKELKQLRTSVLIGIWEKDLASFKFCRIHKSYLVNPRYIQQYNQKERALYLKGIAEPLWVSDSGNEKLVTYIKRSVFISSRK